MAILYGSDQIGGIILGHRKERGIGTIDNRHILTVAGSRGGKGVSLIVPNLLIYDGSVLAIDPKGELARITARARRQKGQKVVVLDPFAESGITPSGRFNPLMNWMIPTLWTTRRHCRRADHRQRPRAALDRQRAHPRQGADLFTLTLPKEDRNLVTVWRLLAGTMQAVVEVAAGEVQQTGCAVQTDAGCTGKFDDAVAGAGANFEQMEDRELASCSRPR